MSDDGANVVVVIALLGSPFSSAYARARQGGTARALDHGAFNVAIYGHGARRWALTEHRIDVDRVSARSLAIGGSVARWVHGALEIAIDERTVWGRPVRGRVTFRPDRVHDRAFDLDREGHHRWWPVAPAGRIAVELDEPRLRFVGHGYHDVNTGTTALESAFARWDWSRTQDADGVRVAYDFLAQDGRRGSLSLNAKRDAPDETTGRARLPTTRWGITRCVPADEGTRPCVVRRLEDGPFYARSLVSTTWAGRERRVVHETLDARRLASSWGRFLARFRTRGAR